MNIPALASDLAKRVPEMAKDSAINNAEMIERLIASELTKYDEALATILLLKAQNDALKARMRLLEHRLASKSWDKRI